jgi:hypothetical protein
LADADDRRARDARTRTSLERRLYMRDLTITEMDVVSGGGGSSGGCYEPCAPPPSCEEPCRPSCEEPKKKCGLLGGILRLVCGIL